MDIKDIEKKETINLVIKQDAVQEDTLSLRDVVGVLKSGKRLIAIFTMKSRASYQRELLIKS